MSERKSWICSGCGALDPPIQVRPIKKSRNWRDIQIENVAKRAGGDQDASLSVDSPVNVLRKTKLP